MCSPTNDMLYHPLLHKDMKMRNPCIELQKNKIKAKELVLEGIDKKIYYSVDKQPNKLPNVTIYIKSDSLGGWVEMNNNDPVRDAALDRIYAIEKL